MEGPASRLQPSRGIGQLCADPDAPLYGALRSVLGQIPVLGRIPVWGRILGRIPVWGRIPEAAGAEQYGLALIPPRAFHVTALDGINTGNLESVAPAYQDEARRYLAGLPETLREQLSEDQLPGEEPPGEQLTREQPTGEGLAGGPPAFVRQLTASALARQTWRLTFELRDLVIWGASALAARLCPTAAAEAEVEAFCAARRELASSFARRFGPTVREPYEPHVTLGYFADPGGARRARRVLPTWSEAAQAAAKGTTLRLTRARLYGFTDMATFVRAQ